MGLSARFNRISRELILFAAASMALGMAFSLVDATFNNFLNERLAPTGFQRSFLEFPRELPGFLVVFVSAALAFLCSRRLSVLAMGLAAVGALLIGFAPGSYTVLVIWLFIYSMGQHLFMPLATTIGMELASEGKTGQRLGQLNAVRNLATIMGSFTVVLGFRYLGFTFQTTFALAAVGLTVAGVLLLSMQPDRNGSPKTYLKLHREYWLYYALAAISGSRKQIFITFAPWVLVTIYNQPTQLIATLMTIGGIIGIVFQPFLGWAVDRLGERVVLSSEAVVLVGVCVGYGFARNVMPEASAFLVVCGCYLIDQMVVSVGMARSTFMRKIAMQPADVQPALTAAVTIDHVFSISAAIIGGAIWTAFGYQYVFLLGMFIAALNFFTALRIRIPQHAHAPQAGVASHA